MNMAVAVVAFLSGGMDGKIRNHALTDALRLHKAPDKLHMLLVGQFLRQGCVDPAAKLGVLALLRPLDGVCQLRPGRASSRGFPLA